MRRFSLAGVVAGADFFVSFVSFVEAASTVRLLSLRRLLAFLMRGTLPSAALTGFLDLVLSPLSFGFTSLGRCCSPLGCFFFFFFKVASTFTDDVLVEKTNTSSGSIVVDTVFSSAPKLEAEVLLKLRVKLRLEEVFPLPFSWRLL
jgi:hypothetical protein